MRNQIIDMHAHLANYRIYPQYWIRGILSELNHFLAGNAGGQQIIDNIIKVSLNDFTCSKLIDSMDHAGIEKTVLLMADFGYGRMDIDLSLEEMYQLHYESIHHNEDRLIVIGGCDPRRGKKSYQLFERGIKEFGFRGLKLYPPCGFELDDACIFPLYEICNAHKLPVFIHIGPSLPSMKTEFNFPQSLYNIMKRCENCIFILAHGGVQCFEQCKDLPLMYDNIYLELSGFQNMENSRLKEKMRYLCRHFPDKILFGTDWPLFPSQKKAVAIIEEMDDISEEEKQKIFYKNAMDILIRDK